jgi:purine-binding chemotaxis protein CheW
MKTSKHLQIVVFGIGKELFGVGIETVHEIVKVPEITAVPDAPPFLEGMINLRGKILPVVDLRKRLHLPEAPRSKMTRVLITEEEGRSVGLLVDSVSEVLKIPPELREGPPDIITSIGIEYISGVAKMEKKLITLLDFRKILSVDDMKRVTGTAPAAAGETRAA